MQITTTNNNKKIDKAIEKWAKAWAAKMSPLNSRLENTTAYSWSPLTESLKLNPFKTLPASSSPSQLGSVCVLSCVWLFATPWTIAQQAPLSMGFSRQEYWSGLSFPPPGDLPNPRIKTVSSVAPALQADSLPMSHWGSPKTLGVILNYSFSSLPSPICISSVLLCNKLYLISACWETGHPLAGSPGSKSLLRI